MIRCVPRRAVYTWQWWCRKHTTDYSWIRRLFVMHAKWAKKREKMLINYYLKPADEWQAAPTLAWICLHLLRIRPPKFKRQTSTKPIIVSSTKTECYFNENYSWQRPLLIHVCMYFSKNIFTFKIQTNNGHIACIWYSCAAVVFSIKMNFISKDFLVINEKWNPVSRKTTQIDFVKLPALNVTSCGHIYH